MSWGSMIGAGREMLRTEWYLTAIPGIAILLTVLALNLIGEGLNDALEPEASGPVIRRKTMAKTVCIRNADWVVAWDSASLRHAYLQGGDVAFADNAITFVGKRYQGAADETIDGRGLMVMPGLIDVHAHPGTRRAIAASARSTACRSSS